jgi:hypothetical protein
MPKKLVEDIYNGYMSKMKESMGIGRSEKEGAAPPQPAEAAAVAAPAPITAPAAPAGGESNATA